MVLCTLREHNFIWLKSTLAYAIFLCAKSSISIDLIKKKKKGICVPKNWEDGMKKRMEKYLSNNLMINYSSECFMILLWKWWTSPKWIAMCPTHYFFKNFLTWHIHKSPIIIYGNLLNVGMNVFLMKTVDIVLWVLKIIFFLLGQWEGK